MDYDEIRKLNPDVDYIVEEAVLNTGALTNPETSERLTIGTRIILTSLRLKRRVIQASFMISMARRFAINAQSMRIVINGEVLTAFNIPTQFRFPQDAVPHADIIIEDGWAVENLSDGRQVRWWLGFTELPIANGSVIGVSVLANSKMAQRPFEFQRSKGAEGQLGLEYLVGEVQADWLDEGADIETDLIQSNRDQLQLEDASLDIFLKWGQQLLRWGLRERAKLRAAMNFGAVASAIDVDDLLVDYTKGERDKILQIARKASAWPEMSAEDVRGLAELVKRFETGSCENVVCVHAAAFSSDGRLIQTSGESIRSFGLPLMNRSGLAA